MAQDRCDPRAFKEAIKYLRNAAPEEFDAFFKQFSMYTDDVVRHVTEADHVEILKMQGRAQQCLALRQYFESSVS